MVINPELENVVLVAIYKHLAESNSTLKEMAEDDAEIGKEIIRRQAKLNIDEPHLVRLFIGDVIGYGYDFGRCNGDDEFNRELYSEKVRQTGRLSDGPGNERLLADGIKGERFGWYLTG